MHSHMQSFLFKKPCTQTKPENVKQSDPEDELSTSFNNLFKNAHEKDELEKDQICQATTFPHSMSQPIQQNIVVKDKKVNTDNESSIYQKLQNYKKNQSKVQKLRKLLPEYMRSKLCPQYEKILDISVIIDKHLIKLKKINFMQNFQFLIDHVQACSDQKLTWSIIKQILFIESDFYKIGKDTFQNFVLGLPSKKQNCLFRKQKLRESLFNYVREKTNDIKSYDKQLPQSMLDYSKVSKFYPYTKSQKKSQLKFQFKLQSKKESVAKKQFVQKLKNIQKIKQKSYEIVENTIILEDCRVSYEQFKKFIQDIVESYQQKTVNNMYKSSLMGILRGKDHNVLSIIALLKMINQFQLFLQTYLKEQCQILHIQFQQKQPILAKFRLLCAGASSASGNFL